MMQRLTDLYRTGDQVEIRFTANLTKSWRSGRVVRLDHPGVWVETEDGTQWFVTNRRRIRKK